MAISDAEKIDFLWKKVIYGVSKTASGTNKFGSNETVPSPLPSYANNIWTQADASSIPPLPPATDTATVKVYTGSARLQLTNDPTSPANQSWLANKTAFVPTTFGPAYRCRVFLGDPQTTGVEIFPDSTGYEFVFDYTAGVLNFDSGIPAGVSNGVYIQAYQYTGTTLDQTVSAVRSAGRTLVVADIPARNALTPNTGDLVHVLDASGSPADAGPGEFADYLWTGSSWQCIATAASARTDALTSFVGVTATNFSQSSSKIGTVGNGTRVVEVSVEVTTGFDAGDITIGDAGDNARLLSSDEVDLSSPGNYVVHPVYQFPANADVDVNVYYSGAPTTGAAKITITWA